MNEFKDRLAVVTGASSGIGLAVTQRLLHAGASVIAMTRRIGDLELLREQHPGQLYWLKGDVTRTEDLERLSVMAKEFGRVDFIVPNAGIAMLAEGTDLEAFDRLWAVNGAGALNTVAALKKQMNKPASILFTGTFLSRIAFPGLGGYIASKAALISHARTLAVELAARDIRVNVVSPGPTATPIWNSLGLGDGELAQVASAVNSRLLEGKFLEPQAVADVTMWLLSAGSRSVYGQEIVVDGGYTLR